jgi:hypothetical protein
VLGYLESYPERLVERDRAASQLVEAQQHLQAATDYGNAQIQEAKTRVRQVDRPRAFEINAQKAAIRKLEAELNLANVDLQRNRSLYQQGAIAGVAFADMLIFMNLGFLGSRQKYYKTNDDLESYIQIFNPSLAGRK